MLPTRRRRTSSPRRCRRPTSSAAGLFQFVEQTWLATLKQHGAKYGYARYSELITKGTDGRYRVAGAEARKAVMDLRMDPHAASRMAGGSGSIDSMRKSAASPSPACCETAERTLSVKKVTALMAATATTRAASSTSTSPDRESRARSRPASRQGVLINIGSVRRRLALLSQCTILG